MEQKPAIQPIEQQGKPESAVLYHASQNRDIREFVPRNDKVRDPEEGPGVFATPDKTVASIFLVPTDDSWVESGKFNRIPYCVISDQERFAEVDRGGAIYKLPIDNFVNDLTKGLGEDEWFSAHAVKPSGKEEYDSGLETMLQFGVQVFITDKATYDEMVKAKSQDHGYSLLKQLVSENEKRGINLREI